MEADFILPSDRFSVIDIAPLLAQKPTSRCTWHAHLGNLHNADQPPANMSNVVEGFSRHTQADVDARAGAKSMVELHAEAQKNAMQEGCLGALRRAVPLASAETCLVALQATEWDVDAAYHQLKSFMTTQPLPPPGGALGGAGDGGAGKARDKKKGKKAKKVKGSLARYYP
jgi:hypothetical protein